MAKILIFRLENSQIILQIALFELFPELMIHYEMMADSAICL